MKKQPLNEEFKRMQKLVGLNENAVNKDKSSRIKTFIIMNTDSDERELIDQQKEINNIQKMVEFTGKGSFIKKIQSKYRKAKIKNIEDLFDYLIK